MVVAICSRNSPNFVTRDEFFSEGTSRRADRMSQGDTPGGQSRARGRPRKHLSDRDRTAAWREKHQLRKVTVDVPERHVAELRRLAWAFRSEDDAPSLRQK